MPKLKKIPVRKPHPALDMAMDMDPSFPPNFHVSSKQVPEIAKWQVGKKYRIEIEIEQKSKHESKDSHTSADFDITAYRVLDRDYRTMSDEDFDEETGKALADHT